MSILFIAAVLPIILLLFFIYRKDRVNPEPLGKLILCFLAGCLTTLFASITEGILDIFEPSGRIAAGLYEGYIVAGLSEEFWKLAILFLLIWWSKNFDEYLDGIVYAVFVSMGFACIENIMYVNQSGMGTAIMRAFLAVPAHFLFAVSMGYHLSLAKFDHQHRFKHLFLALFYPVLLHGTYDALLMISDNFKNSGYLGEMLQGALLILFIVFDILMWRRGLRRIKRLQEWSWQEEFNPSNPFEGFTWNP